VEDGVNNLHEKMMGDDMDSLHGKRKKLMILSGVHRKNLMIHDIYALSQEL
jgi:hypothetical protein